MVLSALISLVLNAAVVVLLAVTIFFCFKLNRRILVLQDSKGDMAQLIRKFDETTARASESISELQKVSSKLQEEVSEKIQKANFIADDLAFMIDRGKKVAQNIKQNTSPAAPAGATPEAIRAERRNAPPARGAASAAVNEAVAAAQAQAAPEAPAAAPQATPAATGRVTAVRQRSKAEEELLAALRNSES